MREIERERESRRWREGESALHGGGGVHARLKWFEVEEGRAHRQVVVGGGGKIKGKTNNNKNSISLSRYIPASCISSPVECSVVGKGEIGLSYSSRCKGTAFRRGFIRGS